MNERITSRDFGVGADSAGAAPVYCILGAPIEAIGFADAVRMMRAAALRRQPFLLSTPNLNFLINGLSDDEFRESLIESDLCLPDGMPIVWIARLLGLPIHERVAGSEILEWLCHSKTSDPPLKVFFFGGAPGVAVAAAKAVNSAGGSLTAVGALDPGNGSVAEMSSIDLIDEINASDADFLVVALGAKKGQSWLLRNHERLTAPIRSHLGAAINFQAKTVKRAPRRLQQMGLEWLWRIKEEPHLWKRYAYDGFRLVSLLSSRIIPLALILWARRARPRAGLTVSVVNTDDTIILNLTGEAAERNLQAVFPALRQALASKDHVIVNLAGTLSIDPRLFGLFLLLRKQVRRQERTLRFINVSRRLRRLFHFNGVDFLLSTEASSPACAQEGS